MNPNLFLAAIPSYDNRLAITQKILACEAKRSPLIKVQWTPVNDLHLTLGYIKSVKQQDIRTISSAMSGVSQTAPFMANTEELRIYGTAIVLRVEPYQRLLAIHKKMNQRLIEMTHHQYQFEAKHHFDPHLTIGRIRNWQVLNPLHRQQFLEILRVNLGQFSFLIQQAGLLYRADPKMNYQAVQIYALNG